MSIFRVFVISCFCYFVFSRGVFSSFRMAYFRLFSHGVISPRKDEKTPCEKTTRRNNAKRKDEKTPCEKTPRENTTKLKFQMSSFRMALFFSSFRAKISSFRVAGFVFSHGVIAPKRRNGTNRPP